MIARDWQNRLACRLIGLGLWLAQRPDVRQPWPVVDLLAVGRWAVVQLNGQADQREIARRHAKPSTRRRVV